MEELSPKKPLVDREQHEMFESHLNSILLNDGVQDEDTAVENIERLKAQLAKETKILEQTQHENGKEDDHLGETASSKGSLAEKEQMLVRLLEKERDLRVSPATQKEMEQAEQSVSSEWMDIAEDIQQRLIQEHNASAKSEEAKITVHELRVAALRHPEVCFWVRYNRARQGDLRVGDKAPNVPLRLADDNSQTALLADERKRCVVLCGSWS